MTLADRIRSTESVTVEGITYQYLVVDKKLDSRLKYFVGVLEGQLFLSEETPEEFRPYVIAHEVFCVLKGENADGRCKRAAEKELALVPAHLKGRYTEFRKNFFIAFHRYLMRYDRGSPFLHEVGDCISFWQQQWIFSSQE